MESFTKMMKPMSQKTVYDSDEEKDRIGNFNFQAPLMKQKSVFEISLLTDNDDVIQKSMEISEDYIDTIGLQYLSEEISDIQTPRVVSEVRHHPVLKPTVKLINILLELKNTESTYLESILKCLDFLSDLKYLPSKSVRQFVRTAGFATIYTSVMQLSTTSQILINKFRVGILPLDSLDRNNVEECIVAVISACRCVFDAFEAIGPFLPLYSQFIIAHEETLSTYNQLLLNDDDFKEQVSIRCETSHGESLPSMLIKPVQRLPRYVLLLKEIVSALENIEKNLDTCQISELQSIVKKSVETLRLVAWYTKQCNEVVRENQDCEKLHHILHLFKEGSELTRENALNALVAKGRNVIKEGLITRHHKRGGMREHLCHLMSDLFLCSSITNNGLKLEFTCSFSNAICFVVPVTTGGSGVNATSSGNTFGHTNTAISSTETTWFVIAQREKTLYCDAKNVTERDRWVNAIHDCISKFPADADRLHNSKLVNLVNAFILDINVHRKDRLEGDSDDEEEVDMDVMMKSRETVTSRQAYLTKQPSSRTFSMSENILDLSPYSIQSFWWHLIDVLEVIYSNTLRLDGVLQPSANHPDIIHARQKIKGLEKEVIASLILSIRDDEGKMQLSQLLMNQLPHYLIASGWFIEPVGGSNAGNLSNGERPKLMKLLLFSDVLIGLNADRGVEPLTFIFAIAIENLKCDDYQDGSTDCAICLVDESIPAEAQRRMSIIKSISQSKPRKRVIYAPKSKIKFDWLVLIAEAIKSHSQKSLADSVIASVLNSPGPLHRVMLDVATPIWGRQSEDS